MLKVLVNKPYLPSMSKYISYLERIWDSNHLTNFGPLHNLLEERLEEYLGVKTLNLVNNGTIALQIAYKMMGLKRSDKIISTPFSFVATLNTALWEGLEVLFCDIDKNSLNIDPSNIANILKNQNDVKAILAVHVFGNPCEVEILENISKNNNLSLIYDAAHAFDVKYKGESVLNYGDISTISFHATKLFHTIEGGAIINTDRNDTREIINFGLKNQLPQSLGVNAKLSEFNAAMGLCVLDDIEFISQSREKSFSFYKEKLNNYFQMPSFNKNATNNFHYFPIIFESEEKLLHSLEVLNNKAIFPRRYFYPSLESLEYIKGNICPISNSVAKKILCLPLFVGLEEDIQKKIVDILLKSIA